MSLQNDEQTLHHSEHVTGHAGKRVIVVAIVVLLIAAGAVAIKYGRYHFFPKRFAVVEPGQLYRSGYLEPRPLKHVIHDHKLKTVLALLNNEPDTAEQQNEEAVASEENVKLIRIGMPGDGCGDFDALDRAADIMADPANRPLLVHCAAGVHRTGAAYAAYRMKYCGWSFEKALAEGDKYGYPITGKPALVDHLREYYETHIRENNQPPRRQDAKKAEQN